MKPKGRRLFLTATFNSPWDAISYHSLAAIDCGVIVKRAIAMLTEDIAVVKLESLYCLYFIMLLG